MTLYILPSHLYDTAMEYLNIIYHKKNLYVNGDIHVLFIKQGAIYIKTEFKYDLNVSEKDLNYQGSYTAKNYFETISYIHTLKYDNVKFVLPNSKLYTIQELLLCEKLSIKSYKKYILDKYDNFTYDEFLNIMDIDNGIDKKFTNINNYPLITEELIKKNINRIVSNFFFQKTAEKNSINLCFLFINEYLKNLKSNLTIRVADSYNNITHGYRLFNKTFKSGKLTTTTDNFYCYLDKLDEYKIYVNFLSFFDSINSNPILEHNNSSYILKQNIDLVRDISESNIMLHEMFHYCKDIFTYDEILYTILYFYELVDLNEYDEVIYYKPIPYNMNIIEYYHNIQKLSNNREQLLLELNSIQNKLKISYKFQIKEIYKCPYCIDGKVYDNEHTFFCNDCNFIYFKKAAKTKYNLDLKRREFKILLKQKYLTLYHNGESRKFILMENGPYFNLIMLRKGS
jgi:hypothetical protein